MSTPDHTPGPLPEWTRPAARAASRVYGAVVARRNAAWDAGKGVVTIDRPVISIGNLSVGGTGKTPMVKAVVAWLLEAGHSPVIAMRGYKAKDGLSDEQAEYHTRFGDRVPVIAQPDRLEGLLRHFAQTDGTPEATDCVVLDDGFQHRRIARQCNVALIDATRDPFTDDLLPAGWLREPVTSLARADAVVLTHAEQADERHLVQLRAQIARHTNAPVVTAAHEWTALDVDVGGAQVERPVEWLAGKRVAAACAIGNPGPFLQAARRAAGGTLAAELVLRDHDPYASSTIRRLLEMADGCDALIVTGKDWSKLSRVQPDRWPCAVARPRLAMGFREGEAGLQKRILETAGA